MATITCAVEVSSYAATAGDHKAKLDWKKSGIPHEQHGLAFTGNGKGKGRRLGGAGSPLLRRHGRTNVTMQVFVRTLAGSSMALDVSPFDTVDAVKAMIEAKARVAAAEQRLVFAGRGLDDGRRTLAEYGVRSEANLFLQLRLRGGAGGDDVGTRGGAHWATAVGALSTMVAVAAALAYFPAAAAAGAGSLIPALLLLWALAIAGVNLIIAGVFLTGGRAKTVGCRVHSGLLSRAFRQNLGILGVVVASLAASGVILGASDQALCFTCFALFLMAMALVTIGVATGVRR